MSAGFTPTASPRTNNYIIPNANQCKGCHKAGEDVTPIGPKARHLNRDFAYATGTENQLAHWTRLGRPGRCAGAGRCTAVGGLGRSARPAPWTPAPAPGSRSTAPTATIPQAPRRTRDSICSPSQTNPTAYGVYKPPVAAGRGSGGREFDIVPGRPDKSILTYRIASTDAGIMMPELGKRLVHEEGLALIREWIAAMADEGKPQAGGPGRSAHSEPQPRPGRRLDIRSRPRPEGAIDGDRFSTVPGRLWKGQAGAKSWWWQVEFPRSREVGAIVQVIGDHELALHNAPKNYVWQASQDGITWEDLKETATADERRAFRVHRLERRRQVRSMRLAIARPRERRPPCERSSFTPTSDRRSRFPPGRSW